MCVVAAQLWSIMEEQEDAMPSTGSQGLQWAFQSFIYPKEYCFVENAGP